MAKGKYTPEKVETILEVLRATGSDKAVILDPEIGISRDTFCKWLKKYPDFSDQVARAKQYFRDTRPERQKYLANAALNKYLTEGAIETWQSEEFIFDANGDLRGRKVIIKNCHRGVPKWAIERGLGKTSDLEDALLVLIEAGLATDDELRIVSQGLTKLKDDLKAARAKSVFENRRSHASRLSISLTMPT
jgi:hypothetical protein